MELEYYLMYQDPEIDKLDIVSLSEKDVETVLVRHILHIVQSVIRVSLCSDKTLNTVEFEKVTDICRFLTKIRIKENGEQISIEHLNDAMRAWLDSPEELKSRIKDYKSNGYFTQDNIREHNTSSAYRAIQTIMGRIFLDINQGTFTEFNETNYPIPTDDELLRT